MNSRINLFSLLLLLLVQVCIAQPTENSLLWKVSGNGLEQESYLYGTIHAICDASLSEKAKNAFEQTEQLALEIDLGDENMQGKMMQSMIIPDGKVISDYLTDEEFEMLSSNLEGKMMGMNLEMAQNIKPLFINMMLIPSVLGCSQQASDLVLFQMAQSNNKPVMGLEEIEDQMKALDDISIEDQVKELLESTQNDLEEYRKQLNQLTSLYQEEDILGMMKFLEEDQSSFAGSSVALLDDRNESWIPIIESMMHEKPSFFGFGALHLPGKKGVIQLLRDSGYTIEAVQN